MRLELPLRPQSWGRNQTARALLLQELATIYDGRSFVKSDPVAFQARLLEWRRKWAAAEGVAESDSEDPNNLQLSIVVPVYNNGRFLLGKCLPSIASNEMWARFEIVLVDDGSNDGETTEILTFLENVLSNVRVFSSGPRPSGSASRPRNIGIDAARAPWVSFLDPDNAISRGGYDRLLELAQTEKDAQFLAGYQLKIGYKFGETGRVTYRKKLRVESPRKQFFSMGRFPTISTQAAIISRKLLLRSGLRFVEGAVGQDTLFGWQVAFESPVSIYTTSVYLMYFAERSNSVTNQKDISFLDQSLLREEAQAKFLRETGLITDFQKNHLDSYLEAYETLVQSLPPERRGSGAEVLGKIRSLYS